MATKKAKPAVMAKAKKPGPPAVAQDKLSAIGTNAICDLIVEGTSYRQIAAQFGVGLGTLATWIEADSERSHACARAREVSAQTFDEKAENGIQTAVDVFELAKAKELAIHYRWRAKAVNPRKYGDKVGIGGAEDLPPVQQIHGMSTEALLAIASRASVTKNP
jgi:hypothetical protein